MVHYAVVINGKIVSRYSRKIYSMLKFDELCDRYSNEDSVIELYLFDGFDTERLMINV